MISCDGIQRNWMHTLLHAHMAEHEDSISVCLQSETLLQERNAGGAVPGLTSLLKLHRGNYLVL